MLTLVDNSNLKKWIVELCEDEGTDSRQVTVPAAVILIPPTDPDALDAALK